jgi:hypothetical protein
LFSVVGWFRAFAARRDDLERSNGFFGVTAARRMSSDLRVVLFFPGRIVRCDEKFRLPYKKARFAILLP